MTEAAAPAPSVPPEPPNIEAVTKELDSIGLMRRDDRPGYLKNTAVQERERLLLAQKQDLETAAERKTQIAALGKALIENENSQDITRALLGLKGWEGGLLASEFQKGPPPQVTPASSDDLTLFATNKMHAELLKEWGNQAPMMLARLKARLARMMEINPEGLQDVMENFSADELRSLYRRLVK